MVQFFNRESERRTSEYVTRKITKAVSRIYYKTKKIIFRRFKR